MIQQEAHHWLAVQWNSKEAAEKLQGSYDQSSNVYL